MELKQYQETTLKRVRQYLELLAKEREGGNAKHASMDAWDALGLKGYQERKNGMGEDLPNFCLKIPTGGGKTLLAVKSLDIINTAYRKKQTGLVVWVVPTTQIYRQTIKSLRDRDHFYRQTLDVASGGRTVIVEKGDKFSPQDVQENLVVLMLMLQSGNRQSKETLRMFKDSGGFQDFFPAEDDTQAQAALVAKVPNLDCYGDKLDFWGQQVKTSLGNTLRVLSPIIILDEGHKAYSDGAQDTLRGFNPCLILELSATPSPESNKLVEILGVELNREEMIKLDLHIANRSNADWKETLLAAASQRGVLEELAIVHEANTGNYIRPICLIQVERTGKDQRDNQYIHAEDARDELITKLGIPPEQVAVKSSEKDELKEVDDIGGLLARECPIRFIITKQALQEGWDCPFAYVLAILTNPSSANSLTQLVGRILRQPYAKKTELQPLNESYVFCFQQRGVDLLENVRRGFGQEGLGDLAGRVVVETTQVGSAPKVSYGIRKEKKVAENVMLPVFIMNGGRGWRKVSYEEDILSRIPWESADLKPLFDLKLSVTNDIDQEHVVGLSDNTKQLIKQKGVKPLREAGLRLDSVFLVRQLLDIVPNPWIAHSYGDKVMNALLKKNDVKLVLNNLVFIVEETKRRVKAEVNRLAEKVFRDLLASGEMHFIIIGNHIKDVGYKFPQNVKIPDGAKQLTRKDGTPLQLSLHEAYLEDEFNGLEQLVAWFLESQQNLFTWFRNIPGKDSYYIQGWRPNRIWPDFIALQTEPSNMKGYVLETKGIHLKGSEDTEYKKAVFELCDVEASKLDLTVAGLSELSYRVVYEDEWQKQLNKMLQP